jgi:hypothetical protein
MLCSTANDGQHMTRLANGIEYSVGRRLSQCTSQLAIYAPPDDSVTKTTPFTVDFRNYVLK